MTQQILATAAIIAQELKAKVSQVDAAIRLLDEGATVPFIARYRKEATGGLDDKQLRTLAERVDYLRELEERRNVILTSIREQEKLTPELEQAISAADTKTRLEDLYLPYRPKRRTKAMAAKEAGLEPLALDLLENPELVPEVHASQFINVDAAIPDAETALEGARQILMEKFAEDANLLAELRQYLWEHGILKSVGAKDKKAAGNKFADYFDYVEPIKKIPSHRALAIFRGRRESVLQISLMLPEEVNYGENRVASYFKIANQGRPADAWLIETVRMTWKIKLFTKLELELLTHLRELADEEAIKVFASNLRDLLLAAPAGPRVTMGLDPGIRTGVKVVVVDITGKMLDYTTVFPFAPQNEWHEAIAALAKLAAKFNVDLISIGNGTASRETERLVSDLIKMYPDLKLTKIIVSEAGASVYSASELATQEFPDLDVSIRGAVSIARRLQDPLAELVKIEPKSIGVGQYQHDVNQSRLARSLEGVVEDCVNAVGVDVNTASVSLLTRVSGFNETLAKNLVQYRNEHGAFRNREQLREIARMGEKTYQQAAGFLRIMHGDNPLDASAVHPEAYPLVEKILRGKQISIQQVIGNRELLRSMHAEAYVDEQFGLPTVRDVLQELEKPGRDPRPEFKTATFKEGVEDISHLQEGMILEGVVSNVTNFGAFVDIGVHQDGLVHISALTKRFISDPRAVVKAGDIVTVKVIEVDKERRRIGLSMRLDEEKASVVQKKEKTAKPQPDKKVHVVKKAEAHKKPDPKKASASKKTVFNTAMADALAKLKRGSE
ncbi:Tex family protein [Legionella septentrionalis]|uniref:RNA-binding transcriptional accessory protein n=1 Tax=Legionella septentrionalis TaxID=2498109 RepID=A0A3S0VAX5_9GAMM|nr:Tex family protein [Legionella septentrionalis]RUQ88674.1 RNA-binding transcriptional accessory protein [Legionella septentrionalis]RUQ97076.1 RNA-binding transcriptional accessory protein [Legionella septentrionalis]RUR11259.1 RNA-binding transcriptional accessory protein [Legionella septentrionalis]RUR16314.1 RNA-binding transcriptional accessory protein [Legionella septentrionalis]